MRDIELNLFGCLSVRAGNDKLQALNLSPACAELLGFLLLEASEGPIRREYLAECFWPDCEADKQRGCLRSALWRLGKALPDWAKGLIQLSGNTVELHVPDGVTLVHQAFRTQVQHYCARPVDQMTDSDFETLDTMLRTYRGAVIEDVSGDWIHPHRERFADMYCQGLEHLLAYLKARGRDHETIRAGHRLLKVDPYREEVHATVINSYLRVGRRDKAQQQFQTCEQLLSSELGVDATRARLALGSSENVPPELYQLVENLQRSVEQLTRKLDDIQNGLYAPHRASDSQHMRNQ